MKQCPRFIAWGKTHRFLKRKNGTSNRGELPSKGKSFLSSKARTEGNKAGLETRKFTMHFGDVVLGTGSHNLLGFFLYEFRSFSSFIYNMIFIKDHLAGTIIYKQLPRKVPFW